MTRLHYVKKARKSKRGTCVKKGLPYYWYCFAYGKKQYSLLKPKRSAYQTQLEYLRTLMDLEDDAPTYEVSDGTTPADVKAWLEDAVQTVSDLGEDQQEKLSSMESAWPNGCPSMEQLQERVEQCETLKDELQAAADSLEDDSTPEQVAETLGSISWEFS